MQVFLGSISDCAGASWSVEVDSRSSESTLGSRGGICGYAPTKTYPLEPGPPPTSSSSSSNGVSSFCLDCGRDGNWLKISPIECWSSSRYCVLIFRVECDFAELDELLLEELDELEELERTIVMDTGF